MGPEARQDRMLKLDHWLESGNRKVDKEKTNGPRKPAKTYIFNLFFTRVLEIIEPKSARTPLLIIIC